MAILVGLVFLDHPAGLVVPFDRFEQLGIVVHGLALDPDAGSEDGFRAQEPGPEANERADQPVGKPQNTRTESILVQLDRSSW